MLLRNLRRLVYRLKHQQRIYLWMGSDGLWEVL
jgi:hypothetical protein